MDSNIFKQKCRNKVIKEQGWKQGNNILALQEKQNFEIRDLFTIGGHWTPFLALDFFGVFGSFAAHSVTISCVQWALDLKGSFKCSFKSIQACTNGLSASLACSKGANALAGGLQIAGSL